MIRVGSNFPMMTAMGGQFNALRINYCGIFLYPLHIAQILYEFTAGLGKLRNRGLRPNSLLEALVRTKWLS
jgi:hypothetical protein